MFAVCSLYVSLSVVCMSKEHKDFRPKALTSVIMKSLRILLCSDNKRGTEDAVASLVHIIPKHFRRTQDLCKSPLFRFFISLQYHASRHSGGKNGPAGTEPIPDTLVCLISTVCKGKQNPLICHYHQCWGPPGLCEFNYAFTFYTEDCRTDTANQFII